MKRKILVLINRLQSYKTAIKNLHWSAKNMSEHKLWDEIADTVADTQDEVEKLHKVYSVISNLMNLNLEDIISIIVKKH